MSRRFHRRGGIGPGRNIGPNARIAPLVSFSAGTFTRSTEASMPLLFQAGDTITWYGANVLRQSAFRTPDGLPYYAFEGSRTNTILHSESLDNAAWSKECPVTANTTTSPDGVPSDAETVDNDGGADRIFQSGGTFVTQIVGSIFARAAVGSGGRLRVGNLTSDGIDLSLTPQWQRFFRATTQSSSQGFIVYASHTGLDSGAGVAGQTTYAWGAQAEVGAFWPSTYIRTTTAAVTRSADDLELPIASVPAEVKTGRFKIHLRPSFSSGEFVSAAATQYLFRNPGHSANSELRLAESGSLGYAAGTLRLRFRGPSGFVDTAAVTFNRGQEVTLTLDHAAGRIVVAGATTGNGTYTGTATGGWNGGTGLEVAQGGAGVNAFFGLLSEPVAA